MPQYLADYYKEKARQLQLDIEHIKEQIEREDQPRELAALKRLKMQMVNERMVYLGALEG